MPTVYEHVAAQRRLVENAQLLYDGCWGKDINMLLEDVPGHVNLQYLPTSQIDHLGLQSLLCPKILPVRKEYTELYKTLLSYWKGPRKLCDGVVITNQSRIGMHLQLSYALLLTTTIRKLISHLLPPALPTKGKEDCCFSCRAQICSISRYWC